MKRHVPALVLLAALLPVAASAGDIHGRVYYSMARGSHGIRVIRTPGRGAPKEPITIFLRGNGMVTTRRGGPKTNTLRFTASGPEPPVQTARLADSLKVENADSRAHRLFFFNGEGTINLGSLASGASVVKPLPHFGEIQVYGDAGTATVLVLENPFEKTANPDGTFLMDGVPPGDYEVCAWTPGHAMVSVPLTVGFDGAVSVKITLR